METRSTFNCKFYSAGRDDQMSGFDREKHLKPLLIRHRKTQGIHGSLYPGNFTGPNDWEKVRRMF